MLIVISNPTPIAHEAKYINALFDEGLELLHIRKPEATVDDIRERAEKKQINLRYLLDGSITIG